MVSAGSRARAADVLARKGVTLRRTANQSVNNTTDTAISWDTEDEDLGGFWSSGTTVTIPTGLDGIYVITFRASANVSGRSYGQITPTSAITGTPVDFRAVMDPVEDRALPVASLRLAAADTFTCNVFHTTGGAANFTAWLSCYRISV